MDLVFVHRDSDSRSDIQRRTEISEAAECSDWPFQVVPLVPIQELEAWLLLSEDAIRNVAGRPSGRVDLGLPKPKDVENTSSPKEILAAALLTASETRGQRHKAEKKKLSARRRVLLERLDTDGPVNDLSSWSSLVADIQAAVDRLEPAFGS